MSAREILFLLPQSHGATPRRGVAADCSNMWRFNCSRLQQLQQPFEIRELQKAVELQQVAADCSK
jgi:hypothetical protein